MRFVHTADWHLGKRLHDFSLHDVQQELLEAFVALVREAEPDAVVVAGDVFDTHVPPLGALDLWENAVEAIVAEAGVPMLVIPGNHDHADRMSALRGLAKRAGLHYFRSLTTCTTPVTVDGVDLYGVPFHKPVHVNAAYRDESPGIGDFDYGSAMRRVLAKLDRSTGRPSVLIAHAFVEGSGEEPEGEDPIMVGGAGGVPATAFAGFAYVALGHIHGARRVGTGGQAHYAGSLYPYSFGEGVRHDLTTGSAAGSAAKSANVVEVDQSGQVRSEAVPLESDVRVQVVEGLSFDEVVRRAAELPERERRHYTLVRITDTGPVAHAIARLREVLPNAVLEQPAISLGDASARLTGDYRRVSTEDAFRQFYRHVYDADLTALEEELLRGVLAESEERAEAA